MVSLLLQARKKNDQLRHLFEIARGIQICDLTPKVRRYMDQSLPAPTALGDAVSHILRLRLGQRVSMASTWN